MYKKILVPMALEHDLSPSTLAIARTLLTEGGEIIALHVHESLDGSVAAYVEPAAIAEGRAKAEALLAEKTKDMAGVTAKLVEGHASRSIIDFASSAGIDCIVIGSHRPGLSDYFLGSTASRVVRHAPCAVHVYRE